MKNKYAIKGLTVLVIFLININCLWSQIELDRKSYYKALSSDDLLAVDAAITKTKAHASFRGFEGALWMRKAGLASSISQKYSFFKKGATMMDEALTADSKNTELKFLRFMVQEQAPRLLNYRSHLEDDAKDIKMNYKSLPKETLIALKGYCNKSEILKTTDFKFD